MVRPKLVCKMIGFGISGTAYVIPWGGGKATIPMNDYSIPVTKTEIEEAKDWKDLIKKKMPQIKAGVNDSGFGVEAIYRGHITVYAEFEHGVKMEVMEITLNQKQLKNAKRGI